MVYQSNKAEVDLLETEMKYNFKFRIYCFDLERTYLTWVTRARRRKNRRFR
jgi:hypothetical protein